MMHEHKLRVYYEDTDLAGMVYYANYLKFIERGRSEWARSRGVDQRRLKDEAGLMFAVRHVEADYLRAVRYDDELVVRTRALDIGGARIKVGQQIWRGDEQVFSALVTLVCLSHAGELMRIPAEIRRQMAT